MAYGQCRCMFMARVHVERLSTSMDWPLPDDLLVWSAGFSSPRAIAKSLSFSSVLNSVSSSWSSSTCLWQMVVNSHGLAQKLSSQRCVLVWYKACSPVVKCLSRPGCPVAAWKVLAGGLLLVLRVRRLVGRAGVSCG